MKNSYIIIVVWAAIFVGILSFGATLFFLENAQRVQVTTANQKSEMVANDNQGESIPSQMEKLGSNESKEKEYAFDLVDNNEKETKSSHELINQLVDNQVNSNEVSTQINSGIATHNEQEEKRAVEAVNAKVLAFVKPVKGEIMREFSKDQLLYSKTLNEWSVHHGTDYAAKLGDEVVAIKSGTVKDVGNNAIYGDYMLVDHGDGYESLYANITAIHNLKAGSNVEQGQVIGYVAESAGFEVQEDTHLHFELKKEGEYISL